MIADNVEINRGWVAAIREGSAAAWPICLGYIAIGLAFGVIARNTGLHPLEIGLMSFIVYAGSAQFIATAMLSAGTGCLPIVLATFSVNLRHLLMSSSLSRYLRGIRGFWLSLFAYGVTDESFALNIGRFRRGNWEWRKALVVNHVTNLTWIASTVLGSIGGQFIPAGAFGIDYALTAMFTCLLVFQIHGRFHIIVAITSGLLAVGISLTTAGQGYVMIAAFLAASAGLFLKRITDRATRGRKDCEE